MDDDVHRQRPQIPVINIAADRLQLDQLVVLLLSELDQMFGFKHLNKYQLDDKDTETSNNKQEYRNESKFMASYLHGYILHDHRVRIIQNF